jgi:hypothetical protein
MNALHNVSMLTHLFAAQDMPCTPEVLGVHNALDVFHIAGAVLILIVGIAVIATVAHRHPTTTVRWTGRRVTGVLASKSAKRIGAAALVSGLVTFAIGTIWPPEQRSGADCASGFGAVASTGLLLTLSGAVLFGLAWAYTVQAGWVVLATLFTLDVWIVFGIIMMHLGHSPYAPDALLLLAFFMHGVCMYLTTLWAFHARDVSTIGQIRAGEAGRSIAAVWVFLAAYVIVGFFFDEAGLFASTAGGAVVSALTLSALALTMGSGYTRYREVMHDEAPGVIDDFDI